ncbi:hypothetical protein CONPUDRAFT_116938 [Coniophora puteana RWD-64-598 SS2]|uniref:Cyclin N-terminal domain-containing protein n=1 Tax=Coniophora puteana (strain RWD-64-598) TaxID=741705 RepID=A0A5M3N167_CONPW|nr:uncharacterized protein CONPUDRAFT_116938 [Coniophora puteana RWD-64-598 SS2]EIW84764.1 hypothetical protein CONPUDRAFT_116938 [Coniophora puteana RWD-64-598 SS2]
MVHTSSSPIHKASLVDAALHSPALLELLDIKVSRPVIEYLVDTVVDTVDYAMGRPSSSRRGRTLSRHSEHSAFHTFVNNVLTRAEVTIPVILVSLVYIDRAKPHLQIALEEWACERVFLGAIMVASKYLNDSTLKNIHWALCTGVFGKRDVGRIEREFLDVLDFELGVSEADILSHHDSLSAIALPSHTHRRPSTVPHSHAGYSTSSHPICPALDPSSPKSSSSSSSSLPRTPENEHSPAYALPKTLQDELELTAPPSKAAPPTKTTSHFSDLLRSFPLPVPRSNLPPVPSSSSSKAHQPHYSHFSFNNRPMTAQCVAA